MRRFRPRIVAAIVAVVGLAVVPTAAQASQPPALGIDLQQSQRHQTIDGFGYATAFGRAQLVYNLPAAQREQVLDLLLDRSGAAPSILRLGISSTSSSIEPNSPGSPDATPQYTWDGWDDGQAWFSQEAKKRGVDQFYADAWSAPGYMKTNGTESNGGSLCGLQGSSCASGDWTTAYADYLVQYANFYRAEGINIGDIGFVNEPDFTASYSSMRETPAQTAEFLKVFGPIAHAAGYKVAGTDSFGWDQGQSYADAISSDPTALKQLDVFTAHAYASPAVHPLNIAKPTWMSEWAPSSTADGWNTAWDSGKKTDGIAIAQNIETTLADADASAYLYWYGVSSGGTAALIQVNPATQQYQVSKRYDAFSAYSRFIRPGAVRLGVNTTVSNVQASAYRNADGSTVMELLNLGQTSVSTRTDFHGGVTAYLTDDDHSVAASSGVIDAQGDLTLPPRSLVTLVRPAD